MSAPSCKLLRLTVDGTQLMEVLMVHMLQTQFARCIVYASRVRSTPKPLCTRRHSHVTTIVATVGGPQWRQYAVGHMQSSSSRQPPPVGEPCTPLEAAVCSRHGWFATCAPMRCPQSCFRAVSRARQHTRQRLNISEPGQAASAAAPAPQLVHTAAGTRALRSTTCRTQPVHELPEARAIGTCTSCSTPLMQQHVMQLHTM